MLITAMMAIVGFSMDFVRTRNKAIVVAETEQNARFIIDRVLWSTRQAHSLDIAGSTFESDNGVLSLVMTASSINPTVFDLVDGAVRIREGSASATPLTTPDITVTKLLFSKDNLGGGTQSVTATIGLKYKTDSLDQLHNYSTSATATAVIRRQRP